MALSYQEALSDGSLDYLALTIQYFDRSDISVYFNDTPQPEHSTWEWSADFAGLQFTPAVAAGVLVRVIRTTSLEHMLHVFSPQQGGGGNAKFTNQTVDENFEQVLMVAQELQEQNLQRAISW